jgi:hypothetical protein
MKEERIQGGRTKKTKQNKMGVGTKEVRKQAEQGGEKPKNKEENPKWWGWKKKTKRGVFTKWQLNSLTLIEFV